MAVKLMPGMQYRLSQQARCLIRSLDNNDWMAVYGKPKTITVDPLLGQMTAKDLNLSRDGAGES